MHNISYFCSLCKGTFYTVQHTYTKLTQTSAMREMLTAQTATKTKGSSTILIFNTKSIQGLSIADTYITLPQIVNHRPNEIIVFGLILIFVLSC